MSIGWGIFKTVFGGGDTLKTIAGVIDSVHTSTEEEIVAKANNKIRLLQAYASFKIAQRYLAFLFSFNFIFVFWICLVMTLLGKGEIKNIISLLNLFYIGEIQLTIIVFYFGGGFIEGGIAKFKEHKNGKS